MKNDKIVSVVIPVYNASEYLECCIDSIRNQTYDRLEIILVNDGSKDNSLKICKKFETEDSRIHVIDQINSGVSVARNKGMNFAKGDYIIFIDADDYIDLAMIEKMLYSMEKYNSQMVISGFSVEGSDLILNDTESLINLSTINRVLKKDIIFSRIVSTSTQRLYGYVWRTLMKLSVLKENNIIFPINIKISEDFMFLLKAINYVESISIVPENLYHYRINQKSATAKYMPTLHDDMYNINKWMHKTICSKYPEIYPGFYCCEANTYLRFIQNICRKGTPYSLLKRICFAYNTKKKYNYTNIIKKAIYSGEALSIKNKISYLILYMQLDFAYIILFSMKIGNF